MKNMKNKFHPELVINNKEVKFILIIIKIIIIIINYKCILFYYLLIKSKVYIWTNILALII